MPDLGSVAAISQLVEQSLQVARVCYTFLHEIKHARKDVRAAVVEFNSMVDMLSTLQTRVDEMKLTASNGGGQYTLPLSIAQAATRLYNLVLDFKALLPEDCDDVSFSARINWVFNAKRFDKVLEGLGRERSKLQNAVIFSMDQTLRRHVVSCESKGVAQSQKLSRLVQGQNDLRDFISTAISTSEARLIRRNISQTASIVGAQKRISNRHIGLVSHQTEMIIRLGDLLETGIANLEDQLAALESTVIQSSAPAGLDSKPTWSEDAISAIIRREMRHAVDLASDAMPNNWSKENEDSTLRIANKIAEALRQSEANQLGTEDRTAKDLPLPSIRDEDQTPDRVSNEFYDVSKKDWWANCYIGTFGAKYRRMRRHGLSEETFIVSVQYLPSFQGVGLNVELKSCPGQTTFWDLSLNIRPLNVIPLHAPIFKAIRTGDIVEVRRLLSEKEASPFDVCPEGFTPLHFAAMHGEPTICQDLIMAKADPDAHITSVDPKKSTRPIDLLHAYAIFQDLANMRDDVEFANYNACLQVLERDCRSDFSEREILEVAGITFLVSYAVRSHAHRRFDPTQLPRYSDWIENLRVTERRYACYLESIMDSVGNGFLLLHGDASSLDPISLYCCWVQCQMISPNWLSPLGLNCIGLLAFQVSKMAEDLFLAKLKLFLYYGADPYLPTPSGILPIEIVEYFDCEDIFLRGLTESGINLDEFYEKCQDVCDKYDRCKAYEEGMIQKTGGGLSTALALEDLIFSRSRLLARRICIKEEVD